MEQVKKNQRNQDQRKQGVWEFYYGTGTLCSVEHYDNGIPHGYWEIYYPNGILECKGYYSRGKRQGEWIWYKSDGTLERQENY